MVIEYQKKITHYNELEPIFSEHLSKFIEVLFNNIKKEARIMTSSFGKPYVFIGSSGKNVAIAKAIHMNLEEETYPTPWTANQFQLSNSTLDGLIEALNHSDFAVFVFAPDDAATVKEQQVSVVRDNVLFELGLSMGRLGKERTFFVAPRNLGSLHIATDLHGITYAPYDADRPDKNYQAALLSACEKINNEIKRLGPKAR
jgi:predicted nucleotide-binding protein